MVGVEDEQRTDQGQLLLVQLHLGQGPSEPEHPMDQTLKVF